MRFMILVKGDAALGAGRMPKTQLAVHMATFHRELTKAGVLLDASGLRPAATGARIRFAKGKPIVIDGPCSGSGDPIAGYTLIQVKSREEAIAWAKRFPAFGTDADGEIEIRELYELDDYRRPGL